MVKSNVMTDFTEYMNVELERRRMSMRGLGRATGYSATQVSDVLNEKVPATAEFVVAVSQALNLDVAELLHKSGHLRIPPPTDLDAQVCQTFRQLSARHQHAVAEIVFALAGVGDVQMYRQTDDALLGELDGANAARADVEAQLAALPTAQEQRATLTELRDTLSALWEMEPRRAAALFQMARVRVFVEDGAVIPVAIAV